MMLVRACVYIYICLIGVFRLALTHRLVRKPEHVVSEPGMGVVHHFSTRTRAQSLSLLQESAVNKKSCSLPSPLKMEVMRNGGPTAVDGPKSSKTDRSALLDSLSNSAARITMPFAWLHWGESDFMSLAEPRTAHNIEGTDYHSSCIVDGLTDVLLGNRMDPHRDHIIEALGAFFLCKERDQHLWRNFQSFLEVHPEHKFDFFDDFYLPVGNESSPHLDSWVVAAKNGKRPIVVVGPLRLKSLHCMLQHQAYLEIPLPTVGCKDVDRLVPQMIEISRKRFPEQSVVFAIAGAAIGKLAAYKAYKTLGDKDIFIDVGASLDAYAGMRDRDYNQDLTRFCRESKSWMSYDTCISECTSIREDLACRKCKSFLTD
eukprot:TRINITY_DN23221_c0_g2_i1.p1 TRINITY_DN23221_c0_g2~~TRINITY_DN23221_c0_g2_i1.p1  ORF type:complete len:372 (+),score=21.43 TRINITY_DN23221_c0_g2_i1:163-1278(+)